MNLKEIAQKGHDADRLLENPLLREALDSMKAAIVQKWEESPLTDTQGQHELRLMLKLLKDFEGNLKRFVQDGKMADFEIDTIRKRDELKAKVKRYA